MVQVSLTIVHSFRPNQYESVRLLNLALFCQSGTEPIRIGRVVVVETAIGIDVPHIATRRVGPL